MKFRKLFYKTIPFIIGIASALVITGFIPNFQLSSEQHKKDIENYENIIKNNSFSDIVTPVLPSVVSIYSTSVETKVTQPALTDPLFQQQFEAPIEPERIVSSNLGSGIILHKDGYILTNHHIIKSAEKIVILLSDGRETYADIIGIDRETDLAVLKIQLSDLIPIKIEQNIPPKIGDIVFTIGNPYGFSQSVSMGILSATGRSQIGINTYENYLQTDAALNPGSSGGALINSRGNLIGLNTAIISNTGSGSGIGFAIPNSIAIDAAIQLIENGKVTRGFLGVDTTLLSVAEAKSLGIEFYAFQISKLTKNGPAHKAGFLPGDIITEIEGEPILNPDNIREKIAKLSPGTSIKITVIRDTNTYDIDIILGERAN